MSDINEYEGIASVVDATEEDFIKFCEQQQLGYLRGLENLLTTVYNELFAIRKDLVEKFTNTEISEEQKTLMSSVFSELLKVEHKIFLLRDIEKTLMEDVM